METWTGEKKGSKVKVFAQFRDCGFDVGNGFDWVGIEISGKGVGCVDGVEINRAIHIKSFGRDAVPAGTARKLFRSLAIELDRHGRKRRFESR
jgi:hypothetical protein